jgi:hypothetical protein
VDFLCPLFHVLGETIDRLAKDVLQEAWAASEISSEAMDGLIRHFAEKLSTRLNESQWVCVHCIIVELFIIIP